MRYLLDTHAFLWWTQDDQRLSRRVRAILADGANSILLSVASLWEISIKVQIGKLSMPQPTDRYLTSQLDKNAITTLPAEAGHVLQLFRLPNHHKDPFDRLLVAQSRAEGLPILTADPMVMKYPVETIW